jgi:hypothetical protein
VGAEGETASEGDVTHMPVGRGARKRNEKLEEINDKYCLSPRTDFKAGTAQSLPLDRTPSQTNRIWKLIETFRRAPNLYF